MLVIVNGEHREINSASVDALLAELDYEGTHFAIALNYDVVPKSRWAETHLKAGDEITIILCPAKNGQPVAYAGSGDPGTKVIFADGRELDFTDKTLESAK